MKESARHGAKPWEIRGSWLSYRSNGQRTSSVNGLPGRHSGILFEHIDPLPWI